MAHLEDIRLGRRARRWSILAAAASMLFAGLPVAAATAASGPAWPEAKPVAHSIPAPSPAALSSGSHGLYHSLSPIRLLDTRETGDALGPTRTLDLRVTGVAGVPTSGVEAVVLDVVATEGTSATYLTLGPTGAPATPTSNVNADQGQTVSNVVITKVGANGQVTVFNDSGTTDVVVDVEGWFGTLDLNSSSTGSTLRSVNPQRLLDTRVTSDPIGSDETMELAVTGVAGVPRTGVDAVVLDVVATDGTAATYLDLHPSGETPNTTSNVNAARGATVSNLVFAKVGADGKVAIHNHSGTTEVVVDIQGWFGGNDEGVAAPGEFHGIDASRLLDTRTTSSPIGPDDTITTRVTGTGGVPAAGVDAVVLNVVATEGTSATYLDLFPTGEPQNTTSNINAAVGATVSNLVVAKVGTDGTVTIYNRSGTTHVVIDVQGWFGATSSEAPTPDTTTPATTPSPTTPSSAPDPTTPGATSTVPNPTSTIPDTTSTSSTSTIPDSTSSTSTIPDSTSTSSTSTVPPSTSTSTTSTTSPDPSSTTSTTSTTAPPNDPQPNSDTSWKFVPETVHFDAAGQSATIHITNTDSNGTPTGTALPSGTKLEVVGDTDAVTVVEGPPGVVTLRSTSVVGSVVVGIRVPGQQLTAPLTAMNVRLQNDVVRVPDDQVVFPAPNLPAGADPLANGGPSPLGPFTIAEYAARAVLPDGAATPPTSDTIFAPDAVLPWVLRGAAPLAGTKLFGIGGSTLYGIVLDRAAGLGSIERSGFSLISVRPLPFTDMYTDFNWDIDQAAFEAAGIIPSSYSLSYSCPDATPADQCPSVADTPIVKTVTGALDGIGGGGFGRARHVGSRATDNGPRSAAAGGPACTNAHSYTTLFSEFKFGTIQFVPRPTFGAIASVQDSRLYRAHFEVGLDIDLSASASFKMQPQANDTLTCALKDLGTLDTPPLGPFAPFLTFSATGTLIAKATVKIEGGPKIEGSYTVSYTHSIRYGFDYLDGALAPIHVDTKTTTADSPFKNTGSIGSPGPSMSAEATLGAFIDITAGVRIGGEVSELLGKFIGNPKLGVVDLASVQAGPRVRLSWENRATVLGAKGVSSYAGAEFIITGSLGSEQLKKMFTNLTSQSASVLPSFTFGDSGIPIASLYRGLSASSDPAPRYAVNGVERSLGAIKVLPNDDLSITLPMGFPGNNFPAATATATGGSAWLEGTGIEANTFTNPQGVFDISSPDGKSLLVTAHISGAWCSQFGGDPLVAHHFEFLAETQMFGVLPTPGWAGEITIQCAKARLAFQPAEIDFDPAHTDGTVVATLQGINAPGWEWSLPLTGAGAIPAWLKVTPLSGTFGSDVDLNPVDLTFSVDCTKSDRSKLTYALEADASKGADTADNDARLTITADCRNKYIQFTDDYLIHEGTTHLGLQSYGPATAHWNVTNGALPDWLSMSPTSGTLGVGLSTTPVTITIAHRAATCAAQKPLPYTIHVTSPSAGSGVDRGSTDLHVTLPAVPAMPCPHPTANVSGDPHVVTLDGARFDTQVLGEYWYVEPNTPGGAGPSVQARHELTSTQPGNTSPATSITGVAIKTGGHLIEVYSRETGKLFVDGVQQALVPGLPLPISDTVSLVRTDNTLHLSADDVSASITYDGSILDLEISLAPGEPVHGLIGTPNENDADDMVSADGQTTYSVDDVRNDVDKLHAFTDSYRLTNYADSMLSQAYAGFNASNPAIDAATLQVYKNQVIARLGAINKICAAPSNSSLAYTINALALELSTGATLPADLGQYTCRYTVYGRVTSGVGGAGVGAMNVALDAPGLKPCTTTSNSGGDYSCSMMVDLDELNTVTPPLPLIVDVVGTFPDTPGVASHDIASFAAFAPLDGAPAAQAVDVILDPASVPTLDVSGTMTGPHGPLAGPVIVAIEVLKGAQSSDDSADFLEYEYQYVTPDPTTGAYSFSQPVTIGATHVVMQAWVGTSTPEFPELTVHDLHIGSNPVTFDIAYRPPVLRVSGVFTGPGGTPLGGTYTVRVQVQDSHGGFLKEYDHQVTPDPTTGAYSFEDNLPLDAVNATVFTTIGPNQYRVNPVNLVIGPNTAVLDAVYRPPMVIITGTVVKADGSGVAGPLDMYVSPSDGSGNGIGGSYDVSIFPAAADGSFTSTLAMPSGTAKVDVEIRLDHFTANNYTTSLSGITPDSTSTITVHEVYAPATLTVHGTAKQSGALLTSGTVIMVIGAGTFDAVTKYATIQPDGTFSASTVVPAGTTTSDVNANILGSPDAFQGTATNIVAGQASDLVLNIDDHPIRVHVSGYMRALGQPAVQNYVFIQGLDVHGNATGTAAGFANPSAVDGSYTVDQLLPAATDSVAIQVNLRSVGSNVTSYVYLSAGALTHTAPDVVNNFVVSGDTSMYSLRGMALDGTHVDPTVHQLDFDVHYYTTGHVEAGHGTVSIPVGADGSYFWNPETPLISDYESIDVTITNLPSGSQTHTIVLTPPGVHTDTWNVTFDHPQVYDFTGTIVDPNPTVDPPDQLVVTTYAFDPDAFDHDPPYTPLATQSFDLVPDEGGTWDQPVVIPDGATMVKYQVLIHGEDQGWTRVYRRQADDPQTVTFDIDLTGRTLQLNGSVATLGVPTDDPDVSTPCAVGAFLFRYTFVGFNSEPDTSQTGDPRQWLGAEIGDGIIVMPDPVTKEFDVSMNLPADVTSGYAVRDFGDANGDIYAVPNGFNTGGWYGFSLATGDEPHYGYGTTETIDCPVRPAEG
ncbi:MAG: hypothetical protein JWN62_4152 [Acidimicrobiales bacterium]|nr:hypothetical protein [Acidimicrobiales bacterium]